MSDTIVKNAPPSRARPRRTRKIDAALRRRIEVAIETMIAALDALDAPAEDREDDDPGGEEGGASDDEPSLGWTDTEASRGAKVSGEDLEDEHDGREPDEACLEPDVDDEPSLCGITAAGPLTDDRDLEDDPECEPEPDREPDYIDPGKLEAARARLQSFEPTLQIERGGNGRLVQVTRRPNSRHCNVRPLTADERKRWGL